MRYAHSLRVRAGELERECQRMTLPTALPSAGMMKQMRRRRRRHCRYFHSGAHNLDLANGDGAVDAD